MSALEEQNAQLDREKSALADLLSAKKREYDQMRQHYRGRVSDLEEETQRLKAEKLRLVEKLQLPESERASLVAQVYKNAHQLVGLGETLLLRSNSTMLKPNYGCNRATDRT